MVFHTSISDDMQENGSVDFGWLLRTKTTRLVYVLWLKWISCSLNSPVSLSPTTCHKKKLKFSLSLSNEPIWWNKLSLTFLLNFNYELYFRRDASTSDFDPKRYHGTCAKHWCLSCISKDVENRGLARFDTGSLVGKKKLCRNSTKELEIWPLILRYTVFVQVQSKYKWQSGTAYVATAGMK